MYTSIQMSHCFYCIAWKARWFIHSLIDQATPGYPILQTQSPLTIIVYFSSSESTGTAGSISSPEPELKTEADS